MAELRNLIIRRGKLKASLTRFVNYVREINDGDDVTQLKVRKEKIEECWSEFDQVQSVIEQESDTEEHGNQRIEFEETYFKVISDAAKYIDKSIGKEPSYNVGKLDGATVPTQNDGEIRINSVPVKLAALNVPIFSGDYHEWSSFYDIFTALINTNSGLTAIQKFFYLRSALSGEALNCIKCFETTGGNYQVAWDSLVKRYNNKKVLIQAHVKAIYEAESVNYESSVKLRQFIDNLNGHIRALESLGQNPNAWGPLLTHVITTKLDKSTLREWAIKANGTEIETPPELITFLDTRVKMLESVESVKYVNKRNIELNVETNLKSKNKKFISKSAAFTLTDIIKCFFCHSPHTIYRCPKFIALSVGERVRKVSELKLCRICLRQHIGIKCKERNCLKCLKPHNVLLHYPRRTFDNGEKVVGKSDESSQDPNGQVESEQLPSTSANAHSTLVSELSQVILSTAVVYVKDKFERSIQCRVLLDSGAQSNFITESMVQLLMLKKIRINHTILGIGESIKKISTSVTVSISSRTSEFSTNITCLVIPRITNELPTKYVDHPFEIPLGIKLADPLFRQPQKIDILIGASHFFELLEPRQITLNKGPILQETQFGWVVAGPVPETNNKSKVSHFCTNFHTRDNEVDFRLENMISKFWRLEEVEKAYPYTIEERACKNYFNRTVTRDQTGRFVVHLPFRDNVLRLGSSYEIAKRRLISLEKRLSRNQTLKAEYLKFMSDYEKLGHMELVKNSSNFEDVSPKCYLPHQAVTNENSTTTKVRVVFDASCKTSSGISLNDVLQKGPVLQDDLIFILARFRTHKFVITADITKMYRQIKIVENHKNYQRILWREEPNLPIKIFKLATVTYGTVPASFLATACLQKIAEQEYENHPAVSEIIMKDFYMDDLLSGASTKGELIKIRNDLIKILEKAGMPLMKWSTNDPDLISDIIGNKSDKETTKTWTTDPSISKILGLCWDSRKDTFHYKVQKQSEGIPTTKRTILARIAAIFDPLGFVGPVVLRCKLLLQILWQLKCEWDESLSENIISKWNEYKQDLLLLNNIIIPRPYTYIHDCLDIQVHGFADASERAYGACLYLRCKGKNNECTVSLICSKSKVAPLKTISLPRLELCAALLLARLAQRIIPKMNLNIQRRYFWSDSKVTLAWITSPSSKWKTFVANRVGEIQDMTNITEWAHIRTECNPADIISRGCGTANLSENSLWWYGPDWLKEKYEKWPINKDINSVDKKLLISESKETNVFTILAYENFSVINNWSSLNKLRRIIAHCFRFIHNSKKINKLNKSVGPILPVEIERAEFSIIRIIQQEHFGAEIKALSKDSGQVSTTSKLFRLHPFIDKRGLLRVGGRLKNTMSIDWFQRHQIVLPADCMFTKLLVRNEHEKLLHGGPQAVLFSIRLRYWPLNARNTIRKIIHDCVRCFRQRPIMVQPIMANLPNDRIEPARPFLKCGVDFAGPFMLKSSLCRKASLIKGYACIFVCFVTKAVHIELASGLSTQDFLHVLNRFFDRRGKCKVIYSDNATNFVGANRHLKEVNELFKSESHQKKVQEYLTNDRIEWKFIPPRSPHFGGLWESAVKSMKNLLFKVLGESHLTYEEMYTVLTRVEACLNSRPITPLSSCPTDLTSLTPGHFLIGEALTASPEKDYTSITPNRLDRWRRVQQFSQHLWKRWSKEYLSQLQVRYKWASEKGPKISVGSVVLIRDENLGPAQWKLGRVFKVNTSPDGVTRTACVRTAKGEVQRAVRNLSPLPFEGNFKKNESTN